MPYLTPSDPLPDGNVVVMPVYVQNLRNGTLTPPSWQDGLTPPMSVVAPDLEEGVGATVQWQTRRPFAIATANATQSIPANTWTALNIPTVVTDSYALQYGPGNSIYPTAFAYTLPGQINTGNTSPQCYDIFFFSGYVTWSGTNSSGTNYLAGLSLQNPTTTVSEGAKLSSGSVGTHDIVGYAADISSNNVANSPVVQLEGYQNSAGALSTQGASKPSTLSFIWIGATGQTPIATQPITPHVWIDQDEVTADATGASSVSPGVKVPLNREIRDVGYFLTNPPIARLTSQGSSQTIANGGGYQSIQYPTNSIDAYGGWSSGSNTRYTAQRSGLYLVVGYVNVSESTGTHNGYRSTQLKQTFQAGGSTTFPGTSMTPSVGTSNIGTGLHAIALVRMAVGDYVEMQMAQTQTNAPTSLTVNTGTGNCSKFLIVWLSV